MEGRGRLGQGGEAERRGGRGRGGRGRGGEGRCVKGKWREEERNGRRHVGFEVAWHAYLVADNGCREMYLKQLISVCLDPEWNLESTVLQYYYVVQFCFIYLK